MEIRNKKAYFNYYILDEYEVGIVLTGTEIKSIRNGKCDIKDSFIKIKNQEAFIINMFINKYEEGNQFNHEETRTRKLLLHKSEIKKLYEKSDIEGISIVPLKVYFKGSNAKLLIGLAKGKKLFDKRETIKKRDLEREARKQ